MRFYRDIIFQAGQIARRNKYLWWFGLFTLFLGGKGIEFELFFSDARLLGESLSPFSVAFWQSSTWTKVQTDMLGLPGGPWVFFLITGVLMLILIIAVVISQGALIDATGVLMKGKTYSLSQGVDAGREKFSRLLGVNVLGKALIYLAIAFIGGVVFFISPSRSVASLVYSIFLFLVITPLTMVFSMLIKYAQVDIMLFGARVGEAWSKAWHVFKRNWVVSIEMAALMFLLYFAVAVLGMFAAALITLPVLMFCMAGAIFFQTSAVLAIYVYVFYLSAVVGVIISALYFATLNYAAWTLLYVKLVGAEERILPKAERLLKHEFPSAPAKIVGPASRSISTSPKTRSVRKKPSPRRTTKTSLAS